VTKRPWRTPVRYRCPARGATSPNRPGGSSPLSQRNAQLSQRNAQRQP
jgi:hypothetical protein